MSLWAKLPGTDPGHPGVALSQPGQNHSGLETYYSSSLGGWVFLRHADDASSGGTASRAVQPACATGDTACTTARLGEWTNLVGAFDNPNHQIKLYVGGKLVGSAAFTTWDARGGTSPGRGQHYGALADFFPGSLDEVQLFDYQLTDAQVTKLARKQPVDTGRAGQAGLAAGRDRPAATAVTGRGQATDAVLKGGATAGTTGVNGRALSFDGVDDYATTGGPVLDTYQSFAVSAWVRLPKDKEARSMIAVSQLGSVRRSFELYHSSALGGWVFTRPEADTSDAALVRATQTVCAANTNCAAGRFGEWTHVVGVYDADAGKLLPLRQRRPGRRARTYTSHAGHPRAAHHRHRAHHGRRREQPPQGRHRRRPAVRPGRVRRRGAPAVQAASAGRRPLEVRDGHAAPRGHPGRLRRPAARMTLYNGAATGSGWVDGGLTLDGVDDYVGHRDRRPDVDTSASFTVSAFVQAAARPDRERHPVSAPGTTRSAFAVRYVPGSGDADPGRWRIETADADSDARHGHPGGERTVLQRPGLDPPGGRLRRLRPRPAALRQRRAPGRRLRRHRRGRRTRRGGLHGHRLVRRERRDVQGRAEPPARPRQDRYQRLGPVLPRHRVGRLGLPGRAERHPDQQLAVGMPGVATTVPGDD